MNPYSGEIEDFGGSPERRIPEGWLRLTPTEADEFSRLPNDVRLQHYIRNHHSDKCGHCGCFIGNHSLRRFKECAASELARIDTERLSKQTRDVLDSLPEKRTEISRDEMVRQLENARS